LVRFSAMNLGPESVDIFICQLEHWFTISHKKLLVNKEVCYG
jgi:hypothetical protein